MKREFWRKAPQCAKCVYHCSEGTRPDSLDPSTVWKEACRFCGYSFWPELEEAVICFDFKSEGRNTSKDKVEKDKWAKKHLCSQCAFYGMNGFDLRDTKLIKNKDEWNAECRCRGYCPNKENDKGGFCSDYLSLDQWAEVEATPIYGGDRIRKWEMFRSINTGQSAVSDTDMPGIV